MPSSTSDYGKEISEVERDLAELESIAFRPPVSAEKTARYVYRLYQSCSLKGDLKGLRFVEAQIDKAIEQVGPAEDLCLLKANLDFKLHRLREAKRDLAMAPALSSRAEGRTLLAEISFQEGRYAEARKSLEDLATEDPAWDTFARLAHIESKLGDAATADRLFVKAEDEITAKEMRSYSWVQLQRGQLRLSRGDVDAALRHYERANRAYTGHWLVDEHMGDLLAAQEKHSEAAAIYERLLTQVDKPELKQKAGEMYRALGDEARAEDYLAGARADYMESADSGEVHYYHHLTDVVSAAEAVYWARKDIALRNNFNTQAALAWALHKFGEVPEAVARMDEAIASGVHDANIFSKAAAIYQAAGLDRKAHQFEHRAADLNPLGTHLHVH